ncbi:MAG: universal stress protein [Candidatus Nitrosomaritimum yanchengensis]
MTEFAKKKNFDLIIIGARGLTGLKSALMGSTSNAIVQKSKTSVLVVK